MSEMGAAVHERPAAALVIRRLEVTSGQCTRLQKTRILLQGAVFLLTSAVLLAVADWALVLDFAVRAVGLGLLGAIGAMTVVRRIQAGRRAPPIEDLAADVEEYYPDLGQRVRTTLQYGRGQGAAPAAPALVEALTEETARRTEGLDFERPVPWRQLRPWVLRLGLLGLLALGGLLLSHELRLAALRLFLLPYAYTELTVQPGDATVKLGESFTVHATVSGRPVPGLVLLTRPAEGEEWQAMSFLQDGHTLASGEKAHGSFEATLAGPPTSLEYRVQAGSISSPTFRLRLLRPLRLEAAMMTVDPPSYTRKPRLTTTEPTVRVIEGSAVAFRCTFDRPAQRARLVPLGAEGGPSVALVLSGTEGSVALPRVDKPIEWELTAEAEDGMPLEPSRRFRIDIVPDRPPTIRFVHPEEKHEATPSTEVRLVVEAADDFGLAKVGIVYQINGGSPKTLSVRTHPDMPTRMDVEEILALETAALTPQDAITYHAFAEDNHPTAPRRAVTDLRFLDIRPYQRDYQLLEMGGS